MAEPAQCGITHFEGCSCHEAKVRALVEALEPFAVEIDWLERCGGDALEDGDPSADFGLLDDITIGDWRRARAALAAWLGEESTDG